MKEKNAKTERTFRLRALFAIDKAGMRRPFGAAKDGRMDLTLLFTVLALAALGTVMVISAGGPYAAFRYGDATFFARRQLLFLTLGIPAMFAASRIRLSALKNLSGILYLLTVALLLLVLAVGLVGNGAKRWISIGPITIQPSEIAKTTLVLMLARYFDLYSDLATERRNSRRILIFGTLIPAAILALIVVLVMLQKHLSCVIILGLIGLLVILVAGVCPKYIAYFTGAAGIGVTALALFTDYTKERITVWRNPEAYKLTGGWQTLQGLMAIGSGGPFGVGLGKSVLKYCYISEPANDMIFTVLCEELGFFGAAITLFLFAVLVYRGYKTAAASGEIFDRLVAFGITTKIAVQTLLNVAVVTNTIPNTGISLPFFSYGGSSLITLFVEMGILLSVSRKAQTEKL